MVDFYEVLKQIRGTPDPSLLSLIEAGFLKVPARLHGEYDIYKLEVVLQPDGRLLAGDQIFDSLTVAAGSLITAKTGKRTPGRRYYSINGWRFWHVLTAEGQSLPLAELRQRVATAEN